MATSAVINAIYEELLHRPADAAALSTFGSASDLAVATLVANTVEFYGVETSDFFLNYLRREPLASELQPFTQALAHGATPEAVKADILGSAEYYKFAGGTDSGFVQQLYLDVLHRPALSGEVSAFVTALSGGASRSDVATMVLTSQEGYGNLVEHYYQTFLGRAPMPLELSQWVNFLAGGGTDQAFITDILSSPEFTGGADANSAAYTDNNAAIAGNFDIGGNFRLVLGAGAVADGTLTIRDGVLDVQSGATINGPISFLGTGGWLDINGSSLPSDPTKLLNGTVITGFGSGDTIDLTGLAFDPAGHVDLTAGNLLKITEGGHVYDLQLDPTQNFAGLFFHMSGDRASGTDIFENSVPCYCRGTRILTTRGEQLVEQLKIGDQVITRSGRARRIKWIGRRGYAGRFLMGRKDILPICITAGALGENIPKRDLWISPHHAMYFVQVGGGDLLIEARDIVNKVSIFQTQHVDEVEYFHVELATHDVIVAEGAYSETFVDDDSRGMFHNAHEFARLYPRDHQRPVRYCAPRLDEGFAVEAVRRAIARRAGLAAAPAQAGRLRGFVDFVSQGRICGWAQNGEHPETPLCLDIFAGSERIGQTLANRYREDLRQAGFGSGHHGFEFALPAGLPFASAAVSVRRAIDGARLPVLPASVYACTLAGSSGENRA